MTSSDQLHEQWNKLSQVAVLGAIHNSPERQPRPECLKGTRVDLLKHIYEFVDNQEKSQLVWLHGTAGVGKSAVAFTVAERMRGLKASEKTTVEKRLAGTFFFSRADTKRCTTGYVFATLAYQLARNFSSVRSEVSKAIVEDPAVLNPNSPLRDQMEALFLRPLRQLSQRQLNCPPLSFVIDALDECTSETQLAELISLLGQALREPDLPKLHILLTSRSEAHVRAAMEEEELHPLVCEIPVKTSGDSVAGIISLDGADVDNDIYIFLHHSFTKLGGSHPDFPQPTRDQLVQLATRAGRRFIVASTMMKFIGDGHNDPRGRLQIMLDLTSQLLPGTEVYKLYDRILSTCTDPNRAYVHLSIVATLADPLPVSQISKLLGPGQGNDVETTLVQLRSIMDIPTDSSLPVNIYHSSVRDYVSNPSNCRLPDLQYIPPHSLLAYSSLSLIIHDIAVSTALLDGLVELKRYSEYMPSRDPRYLRESLAFIVQPPEPLQVLSGLLWLRGGHALVSHCWLETPDGHAWLQTNDGDVWLDNEVDNDEYGPDGEERWLRTEGGHSWLETESGKKWLSAQADSWLDEGETQWLQTQTGQRWLQTEDAKEWVGNQACEEIHWVDTEDGKTWLQTRAGQSWLQSTFYTKDWLPSDGWLVTQAGQDWLQTQGGKSWLQTENAKRYWLLARREGGAWLQTQSGRDWLQTQSGGDWMMIEYSEASEGHCRPIADESEEGTWLQTPRARAWIQTQSVQDWLQTSRGRCWLRAQHNLDSLLPEGGKDSLWTEGGRDWLENRVGQNWLWTKGGRDWLWTEGGKDWLRRMGGKAWVQTEGGQDWVRSGNDWLQTQAGRDWLQTQAGRDCLQTQAGQDWLRSTAGEGWLWMEAGQDWLQTQGGKSWLQTKGGHDWLRNWGSGGWLQTKAGKDWLQTQSGNDWLQTEDGQDWLKTRSGHDWLKSWDASSWLRSQLGEDWLQSQAGKDWLQTQSGHHWLRNWGSWQKTQAGKDWLQTQAGKDWLQTQYGQHWLSYCDWLKTQAGRDWLQTQAGKDWLQSRSGHHWLSGWRTGGRLQTQVGQGWLQTQAGKDWLQTRGAQYWVQYQAGKDWMGTHAGQDWLQTQGGRDWLRTKGGRDWLQTQGGKDWLQTESARGWLQMPFMGVWVTITEFWSAFEAVSQYPIVPELPCCLPAFQAIQHLKSLPDFLMFPVFLALRHHDNSAFASPQHHFPDVEIIHAMKAFVNITNNSRERCQSASDALKYACHNWAIHLARTPRPWDTTLSYTFAVFWDHNLFSWLEMQWCSKGLRACLTVLYEGEKLAEEYFTHISLECTSSRPVNPTLDIL